MRLKNLFQLTRPRGARLVQDVRMLDRQISFNSRARVGRDKQALNYFSVST